MAFHDAHPTVALSLNVTRIPFSFLGQQPADQDRLTLKRKGIWHDRLMDYAGNPAGRDQFEAQMAKLGEAAGVTFDFNAYIDRQPIESQRLLLWAGRFGKVCTSLSCTVNPEAILHWPILHCQPIIPLGQGVHPP